MKRKYGFPGGLYWLVALIALLAPAASKTALGADEVVIKMATLAPQGSEWQQVLQEMGAAWQKASHGKVVLRLYPGGVAGDDIDVVRKMRLGTLNAGLLAIQGLAEVDRSVLALEIPLAFDDYDQLECVLEQMSPDLEKRFEAKGFVILGWSDAGWTHFFTSEPVKSPDDMKKMKMFIWAGDDHYVDLWKKAGFNAVPLPSTEISTALQTGLVNAVTSTVQGVVLLQWYKQVHQMTDFKWALLLGGVAMTKQTWEKIPADVRPAIKQAAEDACRRLREFSRRTEPKDIEVLKQHGLQVVPVGATELNQWRKLIDGALQKVRGAYVPADVLDRAMKLRDSCRRQTSGAGGS